MDKICSVDGCNGKHHAKGYCSKHYAQIRKHGKIIETRYDEQKIINKGDYSIIIIRDIHGNEIAQAKIDNDDVDKVKKYKWHIDANGYILTTISNSEKIKLHNYIMNMENKKGYSIVVDHINNNKLDNRKCNLRVCTVAENARNTKMKNNKLGIRNIFWSKKDNCYICKIKKDGKDYIKYSKDLEFLIQWRNEKLKELHGEFAYIDKD